MEQSAEKPKEKPDVLVRVAFIVGVLTPFATPWTPYTLILPAVSIVLAALSLVLAHKRQLVKKYAVIGLIVGFAFLAFAVIHYQWYSGQLDEAAEEIIERLETKRPAASITLKQ